MQPDVIIIGSGMGGATLAAALGPSGRQILILERGEYLRPSAQDRDATAIFGDGAFRADEDWLDGSDTPFNPGNYYYVGGNSKFYGAALIRYRKADFDVIEHRGGKTPGWPISYDDLEPDYTAAEQMYAVRGTLGGDPTEPTHSDSYPHAALPDEPEIAALRRILKAAGMHPSSIPLGVDIDGWLAAGQTTWDAYPNTCGAKMDAETCGLKAALAYPNVELWTGCRVTKLHEDADGRIVGVETQSGDQSETLSAPIIVVAAGAVQTAALLLVSANDNVPVPIARIRSQFHEPQLLCCAGLNPSV
jgi:choline dehydrogenase-like flavoprotein